jgi:hypothetical protein
MIASWADLLAAPELATLHPWQRLTAEQQQLLLQINPRQAPVVGFETSRSQRWQQADLAMLLLSQQSRRWGPWLSELIPAGSGPGLDAFLKLEGCRPETWLEICRRSAGEAGCRVLAFKNPIQPLPLGSARDLCLAFAIEQATSLEGLPLNTIPEYWWEEVASSGLDQVIQIGLDLSQTPMRWRLLLGCAQPSVNVLRRHGIPEPWHEELIQWPHHIALSPDRNPGQCGLEILPRYRRDLSLAELQEPPPRAREQWPRFLSRHRLISEQRLRTLQGLANGLLWPIRPPQQSRILCGVNHLKLVMHNGTAVNAKAYVGAFVGVTTAVEVRAAASATESLQQQLLQHWRAHEHSPWSGFDLRPGRSDGWVTAAVLCLLAVEPDPWLQQTLRQRRADLFSRLPSGQALGFNQHTPTDADSSIWLQRCRLAHGLAADPRLQRYIASHWLGDGIATYTDSDGIAGFIDRPGQACPVWTSAHDCVLANLSALNGPLQAKALQQLRQRVLSGSFRSTWWPAAGWALSLAPRGSLPSAGVTALVEQSMSPAVMACLREQRSTALWQAQRAIALLKHGNNSQRQHSAEELLRLQREHKGWGGLCCLQIPHPESPGEEPEGRWSINSGIEGSLTLDEQGHFSAALITSALHSAALS